MKQTLLIVFLFLYSPIFSQDFNTLTGDWIRVKAEYGNGERLPNNHYARNYVRYYFTPKEVLQVIGNATTPVGYSRAGNKLDMGPIQGFTIEQYTNKSLVLLETDEQEPVRHYMIPIDSFRRSHNFKYTVSGPDTIYTTKLGIEPIYPKGSLDLSASIVRGMSFTVAAEYTYVVNKDGTIGDVEIVTSTNPKVNKRLTQLIKKSSGKWIPASLNGNPINVKVKDNIRMRSR